MKITKNTPESAVLDLAKECRRCGNCCRHGSGILVKDDLKNIAGFLGISDEELKKKYLEEIELYNKKFLRPKLRKEEKNKIKNLFKKQIPIKPYGECVFHDGKKGCIIHDVKPLQCRIGNCNENGEDLSTWFLLNYVIDFNDPEAVRQFNIYLKTGGRTIPGGEIENLVDKEKLRKILSYDILMQ